MFAVIRTGGKQYKVAEDQMIVVEKLVGDEGSSIAFDSVLAFADGDTRKVGSPQIAGAGVVGTIVEQRKGDKVIVFKKTRRHNYRRKRGHRQEETVVRITRIVGDGFDKRVALSEATPATKAETRAEKAPSKGTASKKTSAARKAAVKKTAGKKAARASAARKPADRKASTKSTKTSPKAKK